jgi:glycine/D-amino acid oxidase-like deaminating enzyme
MERAEVVVIGAGVAGASLAWRLSRLGNRSVLVLERDRIVGSRSSGRNAGLLRQISSCAISLRLAIESARFFRRPPPDLPGAPALRPCGSLLLASEEAGLASIEEEARAARAHGLEVRSLRPSEAIDLFPPLAPERVAGAVFCPSDGVLDPHALLAAYLEGARAHGARVWAGCPVERLRLRGDRVVGVETASGSVECDVVVNAAGGWAGGLAPDSRVASALRPTRRHLLVTERLPDLSPELPCAWDVSDPLYCRPDSGGLLFCPCDEDDAPDLEERVEPRILREAERKARALFLSLASRRIAFAWAGLRTLTPDGRFVVGFDPDVRGLFWIAGLGGMGISCSPAVGRIAVELLRGKSPPEAEALSPSRLVSGPAGATTIRRPS